MGKKLVISGADFSENGIFSPSFDWYNEGNLYVAETVFNTETLGNNGVVGLLGESFTNKKINCIRIFLKNTVEPTTSFVKLGKVGQDISSATLIKQFSVTAEDVNKGYVDVVLDEAVMLENDESLLIGPDVVSYYYHNATDPAVSNIKPYARTNAETQILFRNTAVYVCMQYGLIY